MPMRGPKIDFERVSARVDQLRDPLPRRQPMLGMLPVDGGLATA